MGGRSDPWHQVFAADNPELGDVSQYKSYADMRQAYVDYWYKKLGDQQGLGEKQTKADFAAAFDKQPASKQWSNNIQLETLNFWKAHPDLLRQATQLGLNELNAEERKLLPAGE